MKMISGSILILAAAVLFASQWLGMVMHSSTVTGIPEAKYITVAIVILSVAGAATAVIGFITDRKP